MKTLTCRGKILWLGWQMYAGLFRNYVMMCASKRQLDIKIISNFRSPQTIRHKKYNLTSPTQTKYNLTNPTYKSKYNLTNNPDIQV
jgi:hypothetical protein